MGDDNLDPIDDAGPLTAGEVAYVVGLVALCIFVLGAAAGYAVGRFL